MSCDEAVVKKLGEDVRADYSASLLNLATDNAIMFGMPLAFGEVDTKGRIKNLAAWKKPTFWVTIGAILICIGWNCDMHIQSKGRKFVCTGTFWS